MLRFVLGIYSFFIFLSIIIEFIVVVSAMAVTGVAEEALDLDPANRFSFFFYFTLFIIIYLFLSRKLTIHYLFNIADRQKMEKAKERIDDFLLNKWVSKCFPNSEPIDSATDTCEKEGIVVLT